MKLEDILPHIFTVVIFIVYIWSTISSIRKKKNSKDIDYSDENYDVYDVEDELTRKIRDEIRQKIEKREDSSKQPETQFNMQRDLQQQSTHTDYYAQLQKTRRQVEETKAQVQAIKNEKYSAYTIDKNVSTSMDKTSLTKTFKSKSDFRKAVILKEILDKPVALQ